jgi:hypothetical protein
VPSHLGGTRDHQEPASDGLRPPGQPSPRTATGEQRICRSGRRPARRRKSDARRTRAKEKPLIHTKRQQAGVPFHCFSCCRLLRHVVFGGFAIPLVGSQSIRPEFLRVIRTNAAGFLHPRCRFPRASPPSVGSGGSDGRNRPLCEVVNYVKLACSLVHHPGAELVGFFT